jgi:biotin carboxyl carrier protein
MEVGGTAHARSPGGTIATMKFWVKLGGREADVECHAEGDQMWLDVGGKKITADCQRLPDGPAYSLLVNGRSHEVRVSNLGEAFEVILQSVSVPVEVRHPLEKVQTGSRLAGRAASEIVHAPMPGLVVAIPVKPGDHVDAGQAVVVVEAMKMRNELSPRHAGRVSAVMVAERESVSAGKALVEIQLDPA